MTSPRFIERSWTANCTGPSKRDLIREVLKDYIPDFYKRESAIDRLILALEE